jgi:hypothetical protein
MPDVIPNDEILVRGVKKDWLNKRGELQYGAFRPSAGKTLVSVIRGIMGNDFCKDKSKEIHGEKYIGLSVLSAGEVRSFDINVDDAPDDFEGHAHIDHINPPLPNHEALAPEVNAVLNERCKAMAKAARFHVDPAPEAGGWKGPVLA